MPRSLALAPLLLLLLASGIAQTRRPPNQGNQPNMPTIPTMPERKPEVRINVVDQNDRAVKIQLLVQLCNAAGVPVAQNITNDRGEVTFYDVGPGSYRIVVDDHAVEKAGISESFNTFEILPNESMHSERVQVKLKEDASAGERYTKGSATTVSAAELNIPKDARKEFDKGNELLAKTKLDDARKHFEKAVSIYPQYASAYNNLGVLWMRSNDPKKARDAFEHALAADPMNGGAAMNLARLVYADRDWAREEELLNRALPSNPQDAQALAMLTLTEFHLKKYPETVAYARRTHALAHDNYAVVHFVAAQAFLDQNLPGEAMVEYKVYLKEAPQSELAAAARKQLEKLQAR